MFPVLFSFGFEVTFACGGLGLQCAVWWLGASVRAHSRVLSGRGPAPSPFPGPVALPGPRPPEAAPVCSFQVEFRLRCSGCRVRAVFVCLGSPAQLGIGLICAGWSCSLGLYVAEKCFLMWTRCLVSTFLWMDTWCLFSF